MNRKDLEEYKQALQEYRNKVTVSPEASIQALVDMGIYTEGGNLHPNYGGPGSEKLTGNYSQLIDTNPRAVEIITARIGK